MTASANDTQVGGDHYKKHGQYQPWDVLQAWLTPEEYRGWQKGVAIVYLARERDKGGDQDIMKAGHHIQKLVEVMARQAATQKATDAEAALNKGVVPLEEARAWTAVPDSFFEQLSVETASMGRDEALDEREELRKLGMGDAKSAGAETMVTDAGNAACLKFLIPNMGVPYSPARSPFAEALWKNFCDHNAAELKILGITEEQLACAGAELTSSLKPQGPGHVDPVKEKIVRELDHSAWTAVLDTGNDGMSLATPRTTTFSDKVKVLSPEDVSDMADAIATCQIDIAFLRTKLSAFKCLRTGKSMQSLERVAKLIGRFEPLFTELGE